MKIIYCNVSGDIMEILQFLLNFFLTEYGGKDLAPFIESLSKNSFDLKSLLKNLNPETIAPLFKTFSDLTKNMRPTNNCQAQGLNPIINFADERVVRSLNKYFSSIG